MSKEILGYYVYGNVVIPITNCREHRSHITTAINGNLLIVINGYCHDFFHYELDALKFNQKNIEENLKKYIDNANKELKNIEKRINEILKGDKE